MGVGGDRRRDEPERTMSTMPHKFDPECTCEDCDMAVLSPKRKPQGGVYAYLIDHGRVWVESFNSMKGTALVRFDPGLGMRSRVKSVQLSQIDFNREWKRMSGGAS